MQDEPIVIRPEDVITRPAVMPETAKKAGGLLGNFNLGQIRQVIKEAREIVNLLNELGLSDQLGKLGIKLPSGIEQTPENMAAEIEKGFAFLNLLKVKYGDIPISQAIEKAKAELKAVAKK